jgi:hypothetical protein
MAPVRASRKLGLRRRTQFLRHVVGATLRVNREPKQAYVCAQRRAVIRRMSFHEEFPEAPTYRQS